MLIFLSFTDKYEILESKRQKIGIYLLKKLNGQFFLFSYSSKI